MAKQDEADGYRAVAEVATGFLVQISDIRNGHLSLTDAMVRENARIVSQLKRRHPDLSTNVVRGLEQHIAHQKATLLAQKTTKR